MNDEKNFSSIPSSYTPSDYSQARYAANTGDADLPIPTIDELIYSDAEETSD